MLKKVSYVVWSAFVVWMVVFLFSINQANAADRLEFSKDPGGVGDQVALKTLRVKLSLRAYVDFLCQQFDPSTRCSQTMDKYVEASYAANAIPLKAEDVRSYVLDLTLKTCLEPSNVTNGVNVARNYCFKAADQGLSGENFGNHPECVRHSRSYIWTSTNQGFQQELACYQNAFQSDLNQAKVQASAMTPVDPAFTFFTRAGKVYCHHAQNMEPEKYLKAIPKEFNGLILKPQGSCQRAEEKWASKALKNPDGKMRPRTENEVKFLRYSLLNSVCSDDDLNKKDSKFAEKCFYGAGLHVSGFGAGIDYSACLTPELIPDDDHSQKADSERTIAKANVYRKLNLDSRACYAKAFAEDFALVKETLEIEQKEMPVVEVESTK